MRIRLTLATLAIASLAACGGGGPGATTNANPPATSGQAATPPPAGSVDCAALETAGEQLFAVQLLAQLTTVDTVEAVRDREIGNFDPDTFLAAMTVLHALDPYTNVLGDPKAAIEKFEQAARAAKDLFATDPLTQAAVDAFYEENVGTVGQFIGAQAAISMAMDEAGC